MNLKEKFQNYLKKKSLWGKITDVLIIALIVAMLIPGSRLVIGGFVNRIKAMVIQPSVKATDEQDVLRAEDYNWVLQDMKGNVLNFNDFHGKVIFLNFWATWCPPCVGEMPEIQALYETYKDHPDIRFLMVSNEDDQTVKHFIQKRGYTFPVFTSKYQSPSVFYSSSIPITFLISKTGRILIREEGASKWSGEKTKRLIDQLIKE